MYLHNTGRAYFLSPAPPFTGRVLTTHPGSCSTITQVLATLRKGRGDATHPGPSLSLFLLPLLVNLAVPAAETLVLIDPHHRAVSRYRRHDERCPLKHLLAVTLFGEVG